MAAQASERTTTYPSSHGEDTDGEGGWRLDQQTTRKKYFVRPSRTRDQAENLSDSEASALVNDHHETNEDRSKQGSNRDGDGQSDRRRMADATITACAVATSCCRDGHGSGRPAGRVGSKFLKCVIFFFIEGAK